MILSPTQTREGCGTLVRRIFAIQVQEKIVFCFVGLVFGSLIILLTNLIGFADRFFTYSVSFQFYFLVLGRRDTINDDDDDENAAREHDDDDDAGDADADVDDNVPKNSRDRSRSPNSRANNERASSPRRFNSTDADNVQHGPPAPTKKRGPDLKQRKTTSPVHALFDLMANSGEHKMYKCRMCPGANQGVYRVRLKSIFTSIVTAFKMKLGETSTGTRNAHLQTHSELAKELAKNPSASFEAMQTIVDRHVAAVKKQSGNVGGFFKAKALEKVTQLLSVLHFHKHVLFYRY